MNEQKKVQEAVDFIKSKIKSVPEVALILGSGLGPFADTLKNAIKIPYSQIPHFKNPSVVGHEGALVIGEIKGVPVIAQQGRWHYYEGHDMDSVVLPARVFAALGVKTLVITNAAGGVNKKFKAGDLMMITDHINLMGNNPLKGHSATSFGTQFPDMSEVYTLKLQKLLMTVAKKRKIKLQKGVYAAFSGPNYETPAEIKMLQVIGASAVGMSTVPEAISASHQKMQVVGISCITNMAAGIQKAPLSHSEVKDTATQVMDKFIDLLSNLVAALK